MALARYEGVAVDSSGNVQSTPTIEVRSELTGALAALYSDRLGISAITNPFTGNADGSFAFHVVGGAYRIIASKGTTRRVLRYKAIGTASEFDLTAAAAAGANAAAFLIETQVADESAALEFNVAGHSTSFGMLEFRLSGIRPATDAAALWLRIGTGDGPTYQSGAADYAWQLNDGTMSPAITASADNSDSEIQIASNLGNAASESYQGIVFVGDLDQTTQYKLFGWRGTHLSPHPEITTSFGSGRFMTSTVAITGVRFQMSTGNIAEGRISLYGFIK